MTTKMRRGRDPEQHVTHSSRAEAQSFKGMHGEITLLANGAAEHSALVELRAHDGLHYGGYSVPLTPSGSIAAQLPVARVVAPMPVTTTGADEAVAVLHQLGYIPMVQVLDAAGKLAPVEVEHHDPESLTISVPTAGAYTVYLR